MSFVPINLLSEKLAQSSGVIAPYVVNDLVIREDNCNLSCEYCLTGQSQFKQDHSQQKIFDPPQPDTCLPGTELHQRLQVILDGVATQQVPVVKISGGEVMLIRGIMELIEELSQRYETVVMLTNAVMLDAAKLERLAQLGNVVIQISLDSTRYAGNSYRVRSQAIHDRLIERIFAVLESGLPVELYTVLNDRSITQIEATLEDLLPYANRDVSIFPFPVRGPDRQQFLPRPEQYGHLQRVIDNAERYAGLLPHPLYLQRLTRFFAEEGRQFRCHLPRVAFTAFDDGSVTSCPNIWFNHVGNLIQQPAEQVFERATSAPFRRLLLSERPRLDACQACFTPWDPISLYFEGQIDSDELATIPIYRGQRTRERIEAIRAAYQHAS